MKLYLMPRGTGKTASIKILAKANPDKKICVIEPASIVVQRLQNECPNLTVLSAHQIEHLRGECFDYIFIDDLNHVMKSLLSFYAPSSKIIATLSPEEGIDGPLIEGLKLK